MRLDRLLSTAPFRLALLYAGLFAGSAAMLTAVTYFGMSRALELQLRSAISSELDGLLDAFRRGGTTGLVAAVDQRRADRGAKPFIYAYYDEHGQLVAGDSIAAAEPKPGWSQFETAAAGHLEDDAPSFIGRSMTLSSGGRLVVGREIDELDDLQDLLLAASGWTIAVTILLAVLGGIAMSSLTLRRVEAINATTSRIMAGDLAQRMPLSGSGDEFDRLSERINQMLDRIGELMEGIRTVSDDIAHDLRTPLGRLRQHLETTLAEAKDPDEYRDAVRDAIARTDGLLETFSALLRIAQIESGSRRAGFAPLDLGELLTSLHETYEPVALDGGRLFRAQCFYGISVRGDRELLTQMFVNLIENSLRHTPEGSCVDVTVAMEASHPTVVVADDGVGIPPNAREKVFRRFFRLDPSRRSPGTGLGLSLVAAVARLHDIDVALEDGQPGLRVVLKFPEV